MALEALLSEVGTPSFQAARKENCFLLLPSTATYLAGTVVLALGGPWSAGKSKRLTLLSADIAMVLWWQLNRHVVDEAT